MGYLDYNGLETQVECIKKYVKAEVGKAAPTTIPDEEIEEYWSGIDPEAFSEFLPLSGGTLTGLVYGVTPPANDDSTKLATTAWVRTYIPVEGNAGSHNSIYRGKNLGNAVTANQYDVIDAGTFDDLFIGDYWVINGINWRIAAFDYWFDTGDTSGNICTTHHVVIVPDICLTLSKMHNTNNALGYASSDFYNGTNSVTGKAEATTIVNNAFGSAHILSHKNLFVNALTNGIPTGKAYYDSTVDLMTESMVYGHAFFEPKSSGTNNPEIYSIDVIQLPLFSKAISSRLALDSNGNRRVWALRNTASSTNYASCGDNGRASTTTSTNTSLGIRPAFGICKSN